MKARPPYIRAMMEPAVALAYREAGRGRGSAGHGGERAGGRLPRITVLEVMAADRGGVRERAVIRLSLLRGVVGSRGRLRAPPPPPRFSDHRGFAPAGAHGLLTPVQDRTIKTLVFCGGLFRNDIKRDAREKSWPWKSTGSNQSPITDGNH